MVNLIARTWLQTWGQIKLAFLRTEKTKLLLQGSVGSLVLRTCGVGLRVMVAILLARLLGSSAYGIYVYAVAWLAFLAIPTTLGFDHVLLRYVAAYKETQSWAALKGLLRFAVVRTLGAAIVVSVISIGVVTLLPGMGSDLRATMGILFGILPFMVLTQVRQASLRGLDYPVLALVPEIIMLPVIFLLLVAGARFLVGMDLTAPQAALANATAWIVAFVIGTLFLLRKLPEPVRASAPEYEKAQWIAMVPPLVFVLGAYHLASRGEVLVLGYIGTSGDVGIYTAASRGAELMLFMYDAVGIAGASLFSSIYATGDRAELQRFTTLVTKVNLWGTLPAYVVFFAAAPWFLGLFGTEFVQGSTALRFLSTTFFLSSLGGFVIIMLFMTGHQRDVAVVMGIMAAVNLALSFLLIPQLGIMGAAIASGTTLILLKGTCVVVLYKRVGIVSLPINLAKRMAGGAH